MAHQVVVEGIELLEQDVSRLAPLEEIKQAANRVLEMRDVEIDGRSAHDRLEVTSHMDIDLALLLPQVLVDDVFEKLQVAAANPHLANAQLQQPRLEIHRNLQVALHEEP